MSLFTDYTKFPEPPQRRNNLQVDLVGGRSTLLLSTTDNKVTLLVDDGWTTLGGTLTREESKKLLLWLMETYWDLPEDEGEA